VPMSGDSVNRRYDIVAETRRRWSKTEKLAIVAEASAPDVNVSAVARRHGIQPSLLFRWREQFADALESNAQPPRSPNGPGPSFVPVALPAATATPEQPACTVEIVLRNGRRVRVRATIDTAALKRIVDVLEDR
jgi:Transposase and inactivated derivatives